MLPGFQHRPPGNHQNFRRPEISRQMFGDMSQIGRTGRPFQPPRANFGQPNPRGGILSRLFGGRNRAMGAFNQQPVNPFQFAGGGSQQAQSGFLRMLNPQSISNFLGQTQQVLRTGQQIGSMVQQYGPLIRNLPTLWKLYRGFQSSGEEENNENHEANDSGQADQQTNDIQLQTEQEIKIEEDDKLLSEIDNIIVSEDLPLQEKEPLKETKKEKMPNRPFQPKQSKPKLYI